MINAYEPYWFILFWKGLIHMKLLITDIDNTLYDWFAFFTKSFKAMVIELSYLLNISEEQLLIEFKEIHQRYGCTEQPFAILELPSVKKHFGSLSRLELMHKLDRPLYAFNSTRKKHLKLYDTVQPTLDILKNNDIRIVGYTESIMENSLFRLCKLDLITYLDRLYVLEGCYPGHPDPNKEYDLKLPDGFIKVVPRAERKPDPHLLLDICHHETVPVKDVLYVGDSLTRDVPMATLAEITSIWARYGTRLDTSYWPLLLSISHWTDEETAREDELKKKHAHLQPDYIIDSFNELLPIIGIISE